MNLKILWNVLRKTKFHPSSIISQQKLSNKRNLLPSSRVKMIQGNKIKRENIVKKSLLWYCPYFFLRIVKNSRNSINVKECTSENDCLICSRTQKRRMWLSYEVGMLKLHDPWDLMIFFIPSWKRMSGHLILVYF